jgi:CDP-glucose 4,6-dehydratase
MDKVVIKELFGGIYKGRKVLITGHTGFKGSWLSILLHQLDADVFGYALNPPTNPNLYELANVDQLLTSTIGDIRDYNSLLECFQKYKPEIIIHMAAQPLVLESYNNPRETYEVNIMGTVNVFEAIRHTKSVRVILNVTTDKCYENKEWIWGYRENEPLGGYDPYSNSKGCSELVTSSFRSSFFNPKEYSKHGVALASARAGNVIGGGDWAEGRLIPDFIRAIIKGEKVKIRSPYASRPWQHVLDPLSGYLTLCEKLFTHGSVFAEAWNFGPDDHAAQNVEWIINKLCTLWNNEVSYEIDQTPQLHEASFLELDCSKAKKLLGWVPRLSLEKALENIVDWTKAYNNKSDMRQICINQIIDYYNIAESQM